LTAVLISNDFYSVRRDMNADPVSVGSENSLNMIYMLVRLVVKNIMFQEAME
jgi:hypothetical protein